MSRFTYQTKGVCSRSIDVEIEDGIITRVQYNGGCSGNTQGVAALVRGMTPEEAIKRLSGIHCGPKQTSCPDQLATALKEFLAQ
ncbi:MAG: TIGR03905 family TSCPD domain-containing protein [Clostridia bacterium]|nr:TIGR03905 family TSCPD domain-containing protein [Clostridia bacterium]MBR2926244.1 TIGR03905 family TSCPD domain-containing protein [Clostridia bacterium]